MFSGSIVPRCAKVRTVRDDEAALTSDVIELERQYGSCGCRWIMAIFRRSSWVVAEKRVERIWRYERLKITGQAAKAWASIAYRSKKEFAPVCDRRGQERGFGEDEFVFALCRATSGPPTGEMCCRPGVSEQSLCRWKRQFAGMGIADVGRPKQLEDENSMRKRSVADLTGNKTLLQNALRKWKDPPRSARWSTNSERHLARLSVGPYVL